ncbi:chorismate lyase [Marinomonas sp. THO17]|uniref:chorismate--pyruvate lyase family protein n=1 Tax=Marinomonas sp. THO17 TaxID=3149048 RepID=UPI00336BEBA3
MTRFNSLATKQFDYRWMAIHRANKSKIPSHLWPWLVTKQSLTRKLRSISKLSVEVIEDGWGTPSFRERHKLKLAPRAAVRVRTVLLKLDGVTVIYARSIIPARSLLGHWRKVPHLKNKPLGGYLFQHRSLQRSPIEIAELPTSMFPEHSGNVWARRSVFHQYGTGILVNEAFFDTISAFKSPFGLL